MNLNEALKAAIDGHKVELDNQIINFNGVYFVNQYGDEAIRCVSDDWKIVREPVKYSVDVWLDGRPRVFFNSIDLDDFLFGEAIKWASLKFRGSKKYRVTVEEVTE